MFWRVGDARGLTGPGGSRSDTRTSSGSAPPRILPGNCSCCCRWSLFSGNWHPIFQTGSSQRPKVDVIRGRLKNFRRAWLLLSPRHPLCSQIVRSMLGLLCSPSCWLQPCCNQGRAWDLREQASKAESYRNCHLNSKASPNPKPQPI